MATKKQVELKWIIPTILILYLTSCANKHGSIDKYVYLEHNTKMGCVIAHTDRDCGKSTKTLCYAGELFQTAHYSQGQWTFRYKGSFNIPLAFCARCVSERQMDMISDSIDSRQEKLESEHIQWLIDELQELKTHSLQQEAEAKVFEETL